MDWGGGATGHSATSTYEAPFAEVSRFSPKHQLKITDRQHVFNYRLSTMHFITISGNENCWPSTNDTIYCAQQNFWPFTGAVSISNIPSIGCITSWSQIAQRPVFGPIPTLGVFPLSPRWVWNERHKFEKSESLRFMQELADRWPVNTERVSARD